MRNNPQSVRPLVWAVFGLCVSASQAVAEPFVEHLSPPSLTRGQTTRLTLMGTELGGATGLWTSLPPKAVEAVLIESRRDDQAVFEVKVSPDAPLGVCGLRLATGSGLSNVKLFLIDDLPTVAERVASPRDQAPQHLNWPVSVLGTAGESDVDRYTIHVEAGQRVTFEVVGNRLGQDFDPVVTIKDAQGRRIVERDNDVGLMFDCRFAHTFETTGTYAIEVQDARFRGSDHVVYVLRVGRFPEGRVALPSTVRPGDSVTLNLPGEQSASVRVKIPKDTAFGTFWQELRRTGDQASVWVPLRTSPYSIVLEREPNEGPSNASAVGVPCVLQGSIATPGDHDAFAFELAAGQRLTTRVECRPLGSPADLDVTLTDPRGNAVKRADTLPDGESTFEVQAGASGRHVLLVRSLTGEGGPEYVYRITLSLREPAVELVSDASSLAIPSGSYQVLPLSLTRIDYNGPVALELRGAPSGMSLGTEVIREGDSEVVNIIRVAESVAQGVYSVQVVARVPAEGRDRNAVATTLPLIDRLPTGRGPHGEPFELREDQWRLPPTLTDRIAILVTPRSPYTFDLPDRLVVLPRYLETSFRLETSRVAGFDGPISFVARGGSLERLNLQKPRLKAELPPATRDRNTVAGILRSGVNSELRVQRVTVTAHVSDEGRSIDLTRTFALLTRVAYEPSAEPEHLEVQAGKSATVAIRANRLPTFRGRITVRPPEVAGLLLPPVVDIAEGLDRAEMTIVVPLGTKPGVYHVALPGSARVSKFDEPVTGKPIEVVVVESKGGRS
jgi:hypothetical protein